MKFLFSTIFIALILIPCFTMAALNLEQAYPTLPGGQTITTDSSLAEVILYIVGLAILISGIIALISLIFGGIKYASSAGSPEVMAEARSKINNSLLGIVILVGSFLVLNVVNPQLLVMRVEKIPLESNIVLLSEESRLNLIIGIPGVPNEDKKMIEYLVKSGQAFYLNYEIKNLKDVFGEFVVTETIPGSIPEPITVNFERLKWKYIGFMGDTEENIKVIVHEKPDLTGESHTYKHSGRLDENKQPIPSSVDGTHKKVRVVNLEFFNNDLSKEITFKDNEGNMTKGNVSHPPLSIQIENESPGIYLYSNPTEEIKEQRYFTSSIKKLSLVDFDDKAGFIKIRNNPGNNDFLAILYEDENYSDNLRLFFQSRLVDAEGAVGNIPDDKTEISTERFSTDEYGKAWQPSSLQVFKIDKESQPCNEVRLCTEPHLNGDCISYTPDGSIRTNPKITERGTLPIYKPKNLPDDFDDEIKSLKIDGSCLVVLFEHRLKIPPRVTLTNIYYWDSLNYDPGANSEIFIGSETPIISDLTENNPIGRCREAWDFLWLDTDPCASAIAIYPIK